RYYDPEVGRYITRDPIGLEGGVNTYLYAESNPLINSDSMGLSTYMCTKPLHGLGDNWGPRMYPESQFNPLPTYHQFLCVKKENGEIICGGQDRTGEAFFPGSKGKPSKDEWPSEGQGICKKKG
ncbi:RHS repeat domain-containing protein, partial [Chitiniphilus shinanonensis]|uniref:RHS repeat domain-containing protein n=1 Tax=Chitiniphilus shinanonensis TaxID=553088 RepID=UPI00333EC071